MRITCQECRADFVISVHNVGPREIRSSCPYCHASYRISPANSLNDAPTVHFEDQKSEKRLCMTCSKEFHADMREAIPICPDCRREQETQPASQIREPWKVLRGGRAIEIKSESGVREWIRQGNILPHDQLISPEGRSSPAKRIVRFREAFQSQRELRQPPQTLPWVRFFRRYYRPAAFSQWIGFLLLAFAGGWGLYRISTFHPPPSDDPEMVKLVAAFRQKLPAPARPADVLLAQARNLIALDRPEELPNAVQSLEQTVMVDPSSADALGLLAEAYGLAAAFANDSRLPAEAFELADLFQRLYPQRVDGLIAKARTAISAGNFALARSASQKAVEQDSQNERTLLVQARVLLSQSPESLNQVISLASRAVERNPSLLEGYDLMGEAFFRKGEPKLSMDAYERRLQQSPDDSRALYRMGLIQERAHHFSNAKEWYQEALRASANFTPARLALALIYNQIYSRPDLAERHLRDIGTRYRKYARQEESWTAARELVRILLASKREKEAVEIARTLPVVVSDSPDLVISQARALQASGEVSDAVNALENYLGSHPQEAEVHFVHAQALEKRGSAEEAIRAYRQSLERRPQWLDPYFFLIRLLIDRKREEEALDVANAAVSRAGLRDTSNLWRRLDGEIESPDWKSFVPRFKLFSQKHSESAVGLALLGLAHFQAGQFRPALQALERARTMARSMEYLYVYAGRTLLALKDWNGALQAFKEAIVINPISLMSHFWLGMAHLHKRNGVEAEKALSIAIQDETWGYRALNALGDIALARGDSVGAETLWRKSLEREPRYALPWRSLLQTRN